jgi:hypothetical protein
MRRMVISMALFPLFFVPVFSSNQDSIPVGSDRPSICKFLLSQMSLPQRELTKPIYRTKSSTILAGLFQDGKVPSRDDLLNGILNFYFGESYGRQVWPMADLKWNPMTELTPYDQFLKSHPNSQAVALDSGLMTHLPQVIEEAKGDESAVSIRERLKVKLGYRTVYRAVALKDESAAKAIKEQGLKSSLIRHLEAQGQLSWATVEGVYFGRKPADFLDDHVFPAAIARTFVSPFISVSDFKNTAAHEALRHRTKDAQEVYVFEIRVPEIDRTYFTTYAVRDASGRAPSAEVESFIPFIIDPSEIISYSRVDSPKPK